MTIENPVSIGDVTSRSFRPLTDEEVTTAETLLDDAWYMLLGQEVVGAYVLKKLTPNPPTYPVVDPVFLHNVRRLCANAILRVVNNPMGNFEEEGDDFRARRDQAVSSGRLYFMPEELADLVVSVSGKGAFTIKPHGRFERYALEDEAFWEPLA